MINKKGARLFPYNTPFEILKNSVSTSDVIVLYSVFSYNSDITLIMVDGIPYAARISSIFPQSILYNAFLKSTTIITASWLLIPLIFSVQGCGQF